MKKEVIILLFFMFFLYGSSTILRAQTSPDWFTPAQVHSSNDLRRTANLIDGNLENLWTPGAWIEQSYWVVFDLGGTYEIEKIRGWHNKQYDREREISEIYVSNDINDWGESLGNIEEIYNKPQGWYESVFPSKQGRYVKLVSAVVKSPNWHEIQVFGSIVSSVQTYTLTVSSENGVVQKIPDLSEYESGTVVSLTATPNEGFIFNNWSGDISGSENPVNITMDNNKTVTAIFSLEPVDTIPSTEGVWFTPYAVNSSNDMKRVNNLIDGNPESMWIPNLWVEQSYWVILDLGENAQVDKLHSWHRQQYDHEVAIAQIFFSDNLTDWGESIGSLEDIQNQVPGWKETNLTNKSGRFLKLVSSPATTTNWREIEIFGTPGNYIPDLPEPPDSSDTTPPSRVTSVRDGAGIDLAEQLEVDRLSANWDASTDAESGLLRYWYAIGSTSGGNDVIDWTSAGLNTQVIRTGLSLTSGATYYFSVRAENGSGLLSTATNSNGIKIVEELTPVSHEVYITCDPGTDISDDIKTAAVYLESIGGGTIYLPSGEFLFNASASMAGGISIIGQGQDQTILLSKSPNLIDINHFGSKGGALRISGISFMGWTSDAGYTHIGLTLTNIVDFRIDHCYFEGFGYTVNFKGMGNYPRPRGVVDHCTIIRGRGSYGTMYGVTTGPYFWEGDNLNRIEFLGTGEAVFVEDCYFEGCSHSTDGFGGGHYVLRHSTTVDCASVGGHGPGFESSGRGIRCREIYENLIKKTDNSTFGQRWIGISGRGGGGVVFNNTIEYCRYGMQFTCDSDSYTDSDGDGLYDYPALDQIHDLWIWNNTLVNTPELTMHYGVPAQQLILENRDYFFREPSLELDGFTYTPYPYPHPLTQEVSLAKNGNNNFGITGQQTDIQKDFRLNNAYPNPFNPTTVISYYLPEAGFVSLKIYDILGKEIASLVNEKKEAGSHKVAFNAKDLASGMYIYTIQANGQVQSKKMLLLK